MNVLGLVGYVIDKLPLERLIVRPPSKSESLKELKQILDTRQQSVAKPAAAPPAVNEPEPEHSIVHRAGVPKQESPSSDVTVEYQNREIGKLLLRMERHLAQRMRINGIPCDCGAQKHLLDLESLCEETIPMVNTPGIYYRVLEWVKVVGPKATQEAARSGIYDDQYPGHSHEARDLRKELMGTVDAEALFPKEEAPKPVEVLASEIVEAPEGS